MQPVILGIDIGGTRIKAVAVSKERDVVEKYEGPSDAQDGPSAVRLAVALSVEYFRGKSLEIKAIGVGCAGSVNPLNGVVRNSPNFSHWRDVPLKEWIQEDSSVPTQVENDANCAAYCEWKLGGGKNVHNLVLLTLGTGIGGGLILNGELFRGSTGTGGELGHFSIYADGKPCPCGNLGCFERYCSASALREAVNGKYSAREIFMQAASPEFRPLIDRFLHDFSIGLTSIANIFDPDLILVGGGVAKGVAPYFPKLIQVLKTRAFPAVAANVRLEVTQFGNLSGAIGAALLAARVNE